MTCPDEKQLLTELPCRLKRLMDLAEMGLMSAPVPAIASAALAAAAQDRGAWGGLVLDLTATNRARVLASSGVEGWREGDELRVLTQDQHWRTLLDRLPGAAGERYDVEELIVRGSVVGALVLFGGAITATGDDFTARVASVLGVALDREMADATARFDALHDRLTGLPNRALLMQRIDQAVTQIGVSSPTVALVFLDIDGFKLVNDAMSHEAGDELLAGIASRLEHAVRAEDLVGRFAGDEFVVLLHGIADGDHAEVLAARIGQVFQVPFVLGGREALISASIGLVVDSDPSTNAERLLASADAAMYEAKRAGRGRCVRFDDSMAANARDRLALLSELRSAVARGQVEVWFQPFVDAAGSVVGAEALVRWRHPERGLVPPCDFIPLAEEFGLIDEIGGWVLDEALRSAARWPARHDGKAHRVSVNVSTRQVTPRFIDVFDRAVHGSGLSPAQVIIEFTESALAERATIKTLTDQLVRRGAGVAIDDFGTGESSLSRLQRLSFSELKVDQSFVRDVATDDRARAIVGSVIGLAGALGASVIAEGVETPEQHAALLAMGCPTFQGFLFARPMPADDFARWLGERTFPTAPVSPTTCFDALLEEPITT